MCLSLFLTRCVSLYDTPLLSLSSRASSFTLSCSPFPPFSGHFVPCFSVRHKMKLCVINVMFLQLLIMWPYRESVHWSDVADVVSSPVCSLCVCFCMMGRSWIVSMAARHLTSQSMGRFFSHWLQQTWQRFTFATLGTFRKKWSNEETSFEMFFFLVIFITEVRMSIGLWFDSEGFCCIREKQTDRHSQTCWHSQRDSAGTQYGRETGPTPYSTVHCLLTLTQMNPSIQKEIQKHTHTLLPPVVPLPPGISESSCAVVVNQSFLLIDLSA